MPIDSENIERILKLLASEATSNRSRILDVECGDDSELGKHIEVVLASFPQSDSQQSANSGSPEPTLIVKDIPLLLNVFQHSSLGVRQLRPTAQQFPIRSEVKDSRAANV